MLPVAGTMLVGATNTGRPSSASAKRATGAKFRSTDRCCRWLTAYVASTLAFSRASRTLPFHERLARTERGGRNAGATSVTLGRASENTEPPACPEPGEGSAHRSGMREGSVA